MQTFLPEQSFVLSARALDRQRLGKQRVEAKQIMLALSDPAYGWQNHPAVRMWRGHSAALAEYGYWVCSEWIARGYRDSLLPFFEARMDVDPALPRWLANPAFCRSHQSNLIRKLPGHYRPLWPDVPDNLPYVWPEA